MKNSNSKQKEPPHTQKRRPLLLLLFQDQNSLIKPFYDS
jgi:hypothetical protein